MDGDNSHQLEWKIYLFMPGLTLFSSTCKHKAEDQHPYSLVMVHTFVRSLFDELDSSDQPGCGLVCFQRYSADTAIFKQKQEHSFCPS